MTHFGDEDFPSSIGPAISVGAHDPPFTRAQLNAMERQGLIQINKESTHYRLTLKAARVRSKMA